MKEKIKKERRNKNMKGNRGITLIALIITIIVMLILVVVSVNVAINGGLFNTSKKVVRKTDIAKLMEDWTVTKWASFNSETLNTSIPNGDLPQELRDKYPQFRDDFKIENGELAYKGTNEEIRQYVQELGGTIEPTKGSINIKVFISSSRTKFTADSEGCQPPGFLFSPVPCLNRVTQIWVLNWLTGQWIFIGCGIRKNGNFYISPELQSDFPGFTEFPSPNISDPPTPSVSDLLEAAEDVPSLFVGSAHCSDMGGVIYSDVDCGVFVVHMTQAPIGYNLPPKPLLVCLPSLENRTV